MDDNQARRPETPDLPEIDDDAPQPAPKRLVMSRELRGWMAVFAAVTVAAAAVAPSLDYSDFTGFAAPTVSTPGVAAGEGCTDEDQSSGFNGQSVSCDFSCPEGPGTVTVKVDADDSDAGVSGTADCGGDSAHCSGQNMCTATEARQSGGQGSCSGSSDEFYDSGLYVECSADVTRIKTPGPQPGSDWCPVEGAPCIQSACHQFGSSGLVDKCQAAWQKLQGAVGRDTNSAAFQADATGAAGLSCRGFVCIPVVPVCSIDESVLRCTL